MNGNEPPGPGNEDSVTFLTGGLGMGWERLLPPPTRLNSNTNPIHGLTPTAKCCRRFAARLEPPGWRPGDYHGKILSPGSVLVLGRAA